MAITDGGVIVAADILAALGLIDPDEGVLNAAYTPATSPAWNDAPGMSVTKTVGSTSEKYEVTLDGVAVHSAAATDSLLQFILLVDGVQQPLVPQERSSVANDRATVNWSWDVTGLAPGSRVFKIQANQATASIWSIPNAQAHISVKRVG